MSYTGAAYGFVFVPSDLGPLVASVMASIGPMTTNAGGSYAVASLVPSVLEEVLPANATPL